MHGRFCSLQLRSVEQCLLGIGVGGPKVRLGRGLDVEVVEAGGGYHDIGELEAALADMRGKEGCVVALAEVDVEVGGGSDGERLGHSGLAEARLGRSRKR